MADVGEDEVVRHRGNAVEAGLTELALDVVLGVEAVAAVGVDAGVGGGPARLGGQVLGQVGVGAGRLASVEAGGGPPADEIGGLELGVGGGDRELDPLVGTNRATEDDALGGVPRRPLCH